MSIKAKIESLLFVSEKPLKIREMAKLIECPPEEAKNAIKELSKEYQENKRGVRIINSGQEYQMASSPENSKIAQKLFKDEAMKELSQPSLETLTIIAYRGPISKIDLDRIRGINCSLILRNLLIRGLIEVREDNKKNETYYSVTINFIKYLGINSAKELPQYEELNKNETLNEMLSGEV